MDCDLFGAEIAHITRDSVVTLVHFYCGLRQQLGRQCQDWLICSNPCPFLLWIATPSLIFVMLRQFSVVTLVHFYCGLRQ